MNPYQLYSSYGVVADSLNNWCCILIWKINIGDGHEILKLIYVNSSGESTRPLTKHQRKVKLASNKLSAKIFKLNRFITGK